MCRWRWVLRNVVQSTVGNALGFQNHPVQNGEITVKTSETAIVLQDSR